MKHGNLWRTFVDTARTHPAHQAVVGPDGVLDYRRLAAAAAAMADRLSARGVGPGDVVAVDMAVGARYVISVLAAAAVGAAYLPVDVAWPVKRREQILSDAQPSVVLRADDVSPITDLSDGPAAPGSPGPERHDPSIDETDPAYVIYTSGSTGRPKGVVVPARGVHNLLAAFQHRAPLGPGSRHSWWTSPGFDVSVYEMWSALTSGGTLVPVPDAHRRDIDATLDFLARERVASAYLPPQFLTALRDRGRSGGRVPPLRRLLTGVEPIPMGLMVELRAQLPEAVVINGYGPTETTVCATLYTVPDQCAEPQRRTPIGTVIEGNRGFVVDDRLVSVEPGQPGELCVAGRGLALCYLRDPVRTAELFVPACDGDGLMYRTGDLVVADGAGELTFLGRIDDQLKIDGVRIEPAETEAAFRRLAEVTDVAVLARPVPPGGPSVLTAFVVLSDAAAGADGDPWPRLRACLAEELPPQAVPRRFVVLDRIPMTGDGKLDRAALPQLHEQSTRSARNEQEQTVEDACRAVLPSAPPSVLDLGFAELGGDSLQAARLSATLRAATGRSVTATEVLDAATLAELAVRIAALPAADTPADDASRRTAVPLTAGQFGIWATELVGSSSGAFHESVALEVAGPVDPYRTARELAAVLNRHPVFGGRIDEDGALFVTDGEPVSVAVRSVTLGQSVEHAWARLLTELQHPPFALDRGPLVRAAVLGAADRVRVLIVWHHLVVDAWSARVVLEELAAALGGVAPGAAEYGYAEYAYRQRGYLDSTEGKIEVRAAADRVMEWLPRGGVEESFSALDSCRIEELTVGAEVWSRVHDCARRNGTTAFAVTLAAILGDLCRIAETGGRFALAVADREDIDDVDTAGYFLTTVPFGPTPCRDHALDGPKEALRHARQTIAVANSMSRVPFPSLMAELGLRDPRPVAPLVIAWDRDPARTLSVPGCTVRSVPVRPLAARWPWTVLLTDCGDLGMSGRIEYPPHVSGRQVAVFAERLESALKAMVSGVLSPPGQV